MHIIHIMKHVDLPLTIVRNEYAFKKVPRERKATIVTPSYSGKAEHTIVLDQKLAMCTIPYSGVPVIREIRYCIQLGKLVKSIGPDIMNVNSHLQISALSAILASRKLHVPLVVTVHGVYSKSNVFSNSLQKLYLHTFCRFLWNTSRAVICLTDEDADEISKYGCPKEKIVVIPNWVNTELFRPSNRDNNCIFWAGRFVAPKGLEYLVKAARIVVDKHPSCKFILAGDGPLRGKILKMISDERLDGHFILKGRLTNDEVAREMGNMAIFAFPSLKEGMPYAVLEAASSGMAIVASDIPGISSVFTNEKHALLVQAGDPRQLANGMLRLLKDATLRSRLQNAARKLVQDEYEAGIIVNKTLNLYEDIMGKGDKRPTITS